MAESCCKSCALERPCEGSCPLEKKMRSRSYEVRSPMLDRGGALGDIPAVVDLGNLVPDTLTRAGLPDALATIQALGMLPPVPTEAAARGLGYSLLKTWPTSHHPADLLRGVVSALWLTSGDPKLAASQQASAFLAWARDFSSQNPPDASATDVRNALKTLGTWYPKVGTLLAGWPSGVSSFPGSAPPPAFPGLDKLWPPSPPKGGKLASYKGGPLASGKPPTYDPRKYKPTSDGSEAQGSGGGLVEGKNPTADELEKMIEQAVKDALGAASGGSGGDYPEYPDSDDETPVSQGQQAPGKDPRSGKVKVGFSRVGPEAYQP